MEPPSHLKPMPCGMRSLNYCGCATLTPEEVLTHTVRGQYGEGGVKGEYLLSLGTRGFRSGTETFAALKLMIDNWRWADVPFYLRTGNAYPSA